MRKKGPRDIPDFSPKPKKLAVPGAAGKKDQPAPHPSPRGIKPQATSSKSGRRGQ
jgi:hypothetical protein